MARAGDASKPLWPRRQAEAFAGPVVGAAAPAPHGAVAQERAGGILAERELGDVGGAGGHVARAGGQRVRDVWLDRERHLGARPAPEERRAGRQEGGTDEATSHRSSVHATGGPYENQRKQAPRPFKLPTAVGFSGRPGHQSSPLGAARNRARPRSLPFVGSFPSGRSTGPEGGRHSGAASKIHK